jgi:hypothetical protein
VREIARLCDGAPNGLLAVIEQPVEIVDEGLHLDRIRTFHSPIAPFVYVGKTPPKAVDRREAAAHLNDAGNHREHGNKQDQRLPEEVVYSDERSHASMAVNGRHQCSTAQDEQPDGPEEGAEHNATAQREESLH